MHQSGAILHLETPCPWKDHLFDHEKTMGAESAIKFVLYKDENKKYRVQVGMVKSAYVRICPYGHGSKSQSLI